MQNNNQNSVYEGTYYSRLQFRENNGDKALSISYWKGLMILKLSQKDTSHGSFRYDDLIKVYISPTKAIILANEIKNFKNDLESGNLKPHVGYGINCGMGETTSYVGVYLDNQNNVIINIGKFDDSGNIIEQYPFVFNSNYHFGLHWGDITENSNLEKNMYNDIELDQLTWALSDFGRSMAGGNAYSQIDLSRFDRNYYNTRLDAVYDKLGISRNTSNNNSNKYSNNGNSFLNLISEEDE